MNPDISPCLKCPNHLASIDKRLCLDNCQKLASYRAGQDYTKKEYFIVAEGKDLVDDIGGDGVDQHDALDLEENDDLEETEEIIDGDESPGPVKHIPPETSWKKTINPKTAENNKKCAICGKPESNDNRLLRGLCRKPCYNQWYHGAVEHPVLGKYAVAPRGSASTKKETSPARKKLEDAAAKIKAPTSPYQKPEIDRPAVTDEDICQQTATIDMDRYPLIKVAVYRMATRLSLPVSHIIITLLAEALENRRADRG